jgi:hypothetical protein
MTEERIVYSKRTGKRRPPNTVTSTNEPNIELMAKAFRNLYEITRKERKDNKKENRQICR